MAKFKEARSKRNTAIAKREMRRIQRTSQDKSVIYTVL
jgi:hypothetical protein